MSTPRRLAALALAAALGAAACGSVPPGTSSPAEPTPSPAPASAALSTPPATARPAAEVYAEIRAAVEQIRGLQPTKAVDPVTIDADQLRANLTAEFDREHTPAELSVAEDELTTLGLLPEGADLRAINLDFQSGQVAGYYSPEKDELFVVSRSGALGAAELVTYAHEFTHQLQDQHVDLASLGLDAADQSDLQLARLSLVEGDAVSVQTAWMLANLTPEQLGQLLKSALDPAAVDALARAPAFVRETALFPYERGQAFVAGLVAAGGYAAVDAAFREPPASSEQVIHPEKYAAREAPVAVAIPASVATSLGAGWTAAGQDTLGEAILGIWLRTSGVQTVESRTATDGWGGDRLVVLRGPAGEVGVGMITAWDSAADAAEFQAAAALAARTIPGTVVLSDGLQTVVVALGDRASDIAAALAP